MFKINGEYWRVLLVPPNHYKLQTSHQNYTLGVCDDIDKTIYIANNLNKEKTELVLCHEITHAAMFSYNVFLSLEQEELAANLIAIYGEEIVNIANNIMEQIK